MGIFKSHKSPCASQSTEAKTAAAPKPQAVWNRQPIAGVKKAIAIGSGKGGVGKSTTTILLAHALAAQGLRVGLLDADIYGPSLPQMLGLAAHGQPALTESEPKQMIPPQNHGIFCQSMGFLMGAEEAAIWRGPMVSKALNQLARGTAWQAKGEPPLDYLLIDLPPGTGDVHLSLVQQLPLDGAILVTTPQTIALADARKAATMFAKVRTPIIGVVENMSHFVDASGQTHPLFGSGGGQMLADELHAPLLAQLPMNPQLTQAMEQGAQPDSSFLSPLSPVIAAL